MTPLGSSLEGFSVPASYADQLVRLVQRWNVPPDELLRGVGLTEGNLQDPAGRLALSTYATLLDRARTLTGEPGLGFYIGLQKRISGYGYLGFAAMSASSLAEALELVTRLSPVLTTSITLRLRVEGRVACLVVEEHADMGSVRDIALIGLISGMRPIAQMATGQRGAQRVRRSGPSRARVLPAFQAPDAQGALRPARESDHVRRGDARPAARPGRSRRLCGSRASSASARSTRSATTETSSSASGAPSGVTKAGRSLVRGGRGRTSRSPRARSAACSPRTACPSPRCSIRSAETRRRSCSRRRASLSTRSPIASGTRRSRTSSARSIAGPE